MNTEKYRSRVNAGLCGLCGCKPETGRKMCKDCLKKRPYERDKARKLYLTVIDKGLCGHCRKRRPIPNKSVCVVCKTLNTQNAAKRKMAHRKAGLCRDCNKPSIKGSARCAAHAAERLAEERARADTANKRRRQQYAANKEQKRAYGRAKKKRLYRKNLHEYRHKNAETQRKRRKLVGSHTVEQWLARVAYFGWRCRYCACELTDTTLTKDHVIPVTKGGTDWPSNLVPACDPCNIRKGNRSFLKFLGHKNDGGTATPSQK